jgi:hypothetical protein
MRIRIRADSDPHGVLWCPIHKPESGSVFDTGPDLGQLEAGPCGSGSVRIQILMDYSDLSRNTGLDKQVGRRCLCEIFRWLEACLRNKLREVILIVMLGM